MTRLQMVVAGGFACLLAGVVALAPNRSVVGAAIEMPGEKPETWKKVVPSAKDLDAMIAVQTDVINKATKASSSFNTQYKACQRAGYMIALLGNVGTVILEGEDAKKAATLRDAGTKLAQACGKGRDYKLAKEAAGIIAKYPKTIEAASEATVGKWTDLAPIDPLMKEVNSINDSNAKAVKSKDAKAFAKDAKDASPRSRLLACLAVVARDYNAEKEWKAFCDDMCEASLDLAKNFGGKDQMGAQESHNKNQRSCDGCHEKFRME